MRRRPPGSEARRGGEVRAEHASESGPDPTRAPATAPAGSPPCRGRAVPARRPERRSAVPPCRGPVQPAGGEDRLDHAHVRHRVLRLDGQRHAIEDGVREPIGLTCVGVGRVERQRLGGGRDRRIAAGDDEDPRRPVGRDVERDLDRDPALGAVDVDPLVRLRAGRAGECGDTTLEVEDRARHRVDAEAGSRVIEACTRVGSEAKSIRDRLTE